MSKMTLVGIGIVIVGFILFLKGVTATEVTRFGPIPAPNVPLSVVGIIGIITGGIITTVGIHKARTKEIKELNILTVTTETIPGKKIVRTLGAVRACNNPLLGPGVAEIDARRNLMKEAQKLGANAIVGLRTERQEKRRSVTYYMYGTAVIVEDEK